MKYYSESNRGFYDSDVHDILPDDVITLTEEEYQTIINEQSTGRVIHVRNGKVVTEEYVLTEEQIARAYRNKRKTNYPEITEQLDMLWHMMDDETLPGKGSEWYNIILDIKTKYPKP